MYRGWIPHDEGTIAQSADRVLAGQLPHRDFDEVYTGGLTYLHAAGMKVLGVTLRTPRRILFAAFMAFLAAVYLVAARVTSRWMALFLMPAVTVWSVPNYFASLPSWYNLFLATFGVLAFLRFLDSHRRVWLVAAGVAGGLSVLMKIVGVYYLAGGLLFLAYVEQTTLPATVASTRPAGRFWLVLAVPAAVGLLTMASLVRSGHLATSFAPIVVPALACAVFAAWHDRRVARGSVGLRLGRLLALVVPFAAGAALPIAAFVGLYVWQGALGDLIRGVLVLPQIRLTDAAMNPPALATLTIAVPAAVLFLSGQRRTLLHAPATPFVTALVAMPIVAYGEHPVAYGSAWMLARALPLIVTIAGLRVLASPSTPTNLPVPERAPLFLLLTMMAMVGLVQFPYATPTYFCYAAPMTILAAAALVNAQPMAPRRMHAVLATLLVLFGAFYVNRSYGWNLGVTFIRYEPDTPLALARGGLLVPADDGRTYEDVVRLVQAHAADGAVYAGPDSPEVAFLSGSPSPTRAMFELLGPGEKNEAWMEEAIDRGRVRVAVINNAPLFSARLDSHVLALLERRFPSAVNVGRFTVRFN